ncbi:hypothetical protein BST27_24785 [Mycobacterium intermedium]|uniref:Enoyl-CoA hydratase/isomerase domain-containing protein n=1 Tax=Mycobacterium intermedium TaxID=28445 RepID=A0A1E3S5T2_MYCIE|nr:enoyl-CoA hydratase-related protein [Mycobacterium intermedium]MCV6962752.1 enoyl-CoA hydratase/isomerase family protein [Mycobacterium intermedium]ODQ97498.1 hypothetical protein BHQ20_26395 [Mycobacterium intermedium]OPE47589.1 hypothetical protein BV508_21520 [Mycobacterium intermedium]ORA96631.1 hypothetical protein BST27_24785 [Mycobacterium intermedium]
METRKLDHVVYEKDGATARIILDNPDRANAQTSEMVHSVSEALDDAQYDYDIKVVIIKANGKGFCSGHIPDGSYPEFKAESEASGKIWRSAAQITAEQALEFGLVNRVVPRDRLEAEVEELAANIAKAPLITLQATKAGILRAWETMGFRTHQQASNDLQAVVTGSREFLEYMAELMKKSAKPADRV